MTILIVVGEFPPVISGIGDYTALLASELASCDCQVTVLTTHSPGTAQIERQKGVNILRVLSGWGLSDVRRILDVIDEMGHGTIVNIQYGGFLNRRRVMVSFLPFLIRAIRPRCHVVVTLHEFRAQRVRWRLGVVPMLLTAHGVVCVDPPDRQELIRWSSLRPPRITCIPIAPNIVPVPISSRDRVVWRTALGIRDNTPVVAFFGGADRPKGFLELLAAIELLHKRSVQVRLLAIGPYESWNVANGRYEILVRQHISKGVQAGWATVVEKCSAVKVSQCLHAADIAAFPYLRGARSNRGSLLAALAHGLPTVTTSGVDTPNGFDRMFGVATVRPRETRALADCIEKIIVSHSLRSEMRSRALEASRLLSWKEIGRNTVTFYSSLAKSAELQRTDTGGAP